MAKPKDIFDDFDEVEIAVDEPVYTTGVVCKILSIPIWVLKQLDAEGIVCPPRKTEGSARLYSKKDLNKLNHCWCYIKKHKVKIGGLKIILKIEEGTFEGP